MIARGLAPTGGRGTGEIRITKITLLLVALVRKTMTAAREAVEGGINRRTDAAAGAGAEAGARLPSAHGEARAKKGGTEIETTETGKRRGSGRAAHGVGVKKRCLMLDVPVSIVEVDQFLAE